MTTKQLLKMAMQNVLMCFQILYMRGLIRIIRWRNQRVENFRRWLNGEDEL